jgi:hypothetical protein
MTGAGFGPTGGAGFGAGAGLGGMGGDAPPGDGYAAVQIDFEKLKKDKQDIIKMKPIELKTAEEKSAHGTGGGAAGKKGVLKKGASGGFSDSEDDVKRKVSFGKAKIYNIARDSDEDEYNGPHTGGKGSPRTVEEKDISDGRTDKEKAKDEFEKKQAEEAQQIKKALQKTKEMEEEDESLSHSANQSKFSKMSQMYKQTLASGIEESMGESSLSQSASRHDKKDSPDKESYSEDFEDVSGSGSASHPAMARFEAAKKKKEEDTYESSYSQSASYSMSQS